MLPIKFVTDSAADIPRALREELGIQVLPFPIAMGNKELQDGYDFTPEEFYPMLLSAAQIPTHAQLNPFVFSQCFQEAFQEGCRCLIYTAINSKGSATYQNAVQAREELPSTSTFWTPTPTPWATAGRWSRGPEWPGMGRTRRRS